MGWGTAQVIYHLPNKHKAQDLISNTRNKEKEKENRIFIDVTELNRYHQCGP
jgi:hypothetical protein